MQTETNWVKCVETLPMRSGSYTEKVECNNCGEILMIVRLMRVWFHLDLHNRFKIDLDWEIGGCHVIE